MTRKRGKSGAPYPVCVCVCGPVCVCVEEFTRRGLVRTRPIAPAPSDRRDPSAPRPAPTTSTSTTHPASHPLPSPHITPLRPGRPLSSLVLAHPVDLRDDPGSSDQNVCVFVYQPEPTWDRRPHSTKREYDC